MLFHPGYIEKKYWQLDIEIRKQLAVKVLMYQIHHTAYIITVLTLISHKLLLTIFRVSRESRRVDVNIIKEFKIVQMYLEMIKIDSN